MKVKGITKPKKANTTNKKIKKKGMVKLEDIDTANQYKIS